MATVGLKNGKYDIIVIVTIHWVTSGFEEECGGPTDPPRENNPLPLFVYMIPVCWLPPSPNGMVWIFRAGRAPGRLRLWRAPGCSGSLWCTPVRSRALLGAPGCSWALPGRSYGVAWFFVEFLIFSDFHECLMIFYSFDDFSVTPHIVSVGFLF